MMECSEAETLLPVDLYTRRWGKTAEIVRAELRVRRKKMEEHQGEASEGASLFLPEQDRKKNRVTYGDSVKKREFKQVRQGMSMKKLLN